MAKTKSVLQDCPAFAYAAHGSSAIWRCTLKIVYCKEEFVLSLKFCHESPNADSEQFILFRYEGDNLVPGQNSLMETDIVVSSQDIQARNGDPRLRTLSLALKEPCAVWYPKESGYVHAGLKELLKLARATHKLFKGSRQFKTIPVMTELTNSHQKQNWSILNLIPGIEPAAHVPIEDPASRVIPSIEDAGAGAFPVQDDPPPYCEDVSSKRSRCSGCSSTPDLVSKRPRHSACSPSPTELATPTSTLSFISTVQVGLSKDDVTSIILEHLPAMSEIIIQKTLIHYSLLSSNRVPKTSTCHTPTPSPPMTLNARIEGIIKKFNEQLRDLLRDQVQDQTIELEELIADFRSNLTELMEEHVADFREGCNNKLEEFNQMKEDWLAEVEAHALNIVLKFLDNSNAAHNQALRRFRRPSPVPERHRRARSLAL